MQTAGIYIHIPFCRKKCLYCDFYSVPDADNLIHAFVDSLCLEIERCEIDASKWIFDTCFFGGGTPSLLEADQLEKILLTIQTRFSVSRFSEFSLEANPGEISEDKLRQFHSLGVNRLSLGVQSLNSDDLKILDRIHTPAHAVQTFEAARKVGFDNISCDLIYGVPNQTDNSWTSTLEKIIDLNPDHISAYELTIEKGTPLYSLVHSGKIQFPSDSSILKKADITHQMLSDHGYERYEISNYAKSQKYCVHNLHYWRIDPYLGFGPSAHSYFESQHLANVKDLSIYVEKLAQNGPIVNFKENLTEHQLLNEKIGFGLRMTEGFDRTIIPDHLIEIFNTALDQVQLKWPQCLLVQNKKIFLTAKGTTFADSIAVDLLF